MPRAIWKGTISFGLVNIPVELFSAEKPSEQLHYHLLDKKSHSRIHNQRVNEMGQEVAWEDVEHAYEFTKGKYVVVDQKMLEKTTAENYETVAITSFVPAAQINPIYFEKPYYLIPSKAGAKGYVLLHDILQKTKKAGIASVVIKTREHLAAIVPQGNFLILIVLRYAKELHHIEEFADLAPAKSKIKVLPREIALAEQLVDSMSSNWKPEKFHDNSKELMLKLIKGHIKQGKTVEPKIKTAKRATPAKGEKVVDFMELLQKSVTKKSRKTKH